MGRWEDGKDSFISYVIHLRKLLEDSVTSDKKFYWDIKDIHRPADIYGGNGASWEAVPSLEKPLVRVREKPIYERFCFCLYMTTFSN